MRRGLPRLPYVRWSTVFFLFLACLAGSGAMAQNPSRSTPSTPLEFDVATIKPVDTNSGAIHMHGTKIYPGGRVVIEGASLKDLIEEAFGVGYQQISGGEDWTSKTTFDIEAKPASDMEPPFKLGHTWFTIEDERLRQMLQSLLADRFRLKFHIETKPGTIYVLEKTNKPLRLMPAKPPDKVNLDTVGFCSIGRVASTWVIEDCTPAQIGNFARSYVLHRPVLDKTGLDGSFDFRYQIVQMDPSVMPSDDSTFPYAIESMGLKLRQTTGPVQFFIIDHAEQPSPN